ncbi:hypothetical protein FRC00_007988 [Tulasnella sp. 408]|nr:hypothetical protein FRC00_007988 [Tulasnella sp. 408]
MSNTSSAIEIATTTCKLFAGMCDIPGLSSLKPLGSILVTICEHVSALQENKEASITLADRVGLVAQVLVNCAEERGAAMPEYYSYQIGNLKNPKTTNAALNQLSSKLDSTLWLSTDIECTEIDSREELYSTDDYSVQVGTYRNQEVIIRKYYTKKEEPSWVALRQNKHVVLIDWAEGSKSGGGSEFEPRYAIHLMGLGFSDVAPNAFQELGRLLTVKVPIVEELPAFPQVNGNMMSNFPNGFNAGMIPGAASPQLRAANGLANGSVVQQQMMLNGLAGMNATGLSSQQAMGLKNAFGAVNGTQNGIFPPQHLPAHIQAQMQAAILAQLQVNGMAGGLSVGGLNGMGPGPGGMMLNGSLANGNISLKLPTQRLMQWNAANQKKNA